MERIAKKVTFTVPGEFTASVMVGDTIKPGMVIGSALFPHVLEEHTINHAKLLVDDGVYVQPQTPLFEVRKGLYHEIIGSTNEGIVRLTKNLLRVVTDDTEAEVHATVWGKVLSTSDLSYVAEVKFLQLPIFVSKGWDQQGELYCLFDKGPVVASHHINDQVKGKIVVLPGNLGYDTYNALMNNGAKAVLAASIDWNDYLRVFKHEEAQVGILHGFGMFPLWRWYHTLLAKLHGVYVEVDLAASQLSIPVHDILLGSLERDLLLFKEFWWGKQVKELQHESGQLIAHLETNEQTPVVSEELFNIR